MPWGPLGSQYILDSESQKNRLRSFLRRLYIGSFSIAIGVILLVGTWLTLALFPPFCIWYFFSIRRLTRDLSVVPGRASVAEKLKSHAKTFSLSKLIFLELQSLAFVGFGVWLATIGRSVLIAYLCIGFFGFASVVFGAMLLSRLKGK